MSKAGKGKPNDTRPKNVSGSRVRQARQAAGLTQDQLSGRLAAAGMTLDRAAVAKIELGLRGVYDFELIALAKALKVSVVFLLDTQGC